MSSHPRTGLVLVNLGTPDSPRVPDVRRYLREFLGDPRVLDMPAWRRRLLLEAVILPTRPRRSAKAYASIWTDEGSPLLVHGRALARGVEERLGGGIPVELGMRYGRPSVREALASLARRGAARVVALPLFPHWSAAGAGSAIARVYDEARRLWNTPFVTVVPPFASHPSFVEAVAALARPVLRRVRPDRVLFSFHGLPERQIRKSDPTGRHCLAREDCCAGAAATRPYCYRAQCLATAARLGDALGVPADERVFGFQSRLGRSRWIEPHTDALLETLPADGVRRLVVLAPGFAADCLETIEELGLRGAETFREHGGEELALVPCLNATPAWVDAVARIALEHVSRPATREVGA